MMQTVIPPASWRAAALRRIEVARLADHRPQFCYGSNTDASRRLLRGELDHTLGIASVECATPAAVVHVGAPAGAPGPDPLPTAHHGPVAPTATLQGLEVAARRIARSARTGGTFLVGTGHPGNLLLFYMELARLIRRWGGTVIEPARGVWVPPNLALDYMAGVAVVTDGRSLLHTHDCRAMELMLEATESVDLVVGDGGFAGAAIKADIPVVAMLNVNDPLPALARRLGSDISLVPMDGNLPPSSYLPLTELMSEVAGRSWVEAGLPEYSVGWCDRRQEGSGRPAP